MEENFMSIRKSSNINNHLELAFSVDILSDFHKETLRPKGFRNMGDRDAL